MKHFLMSLAFLLSSTAAFAVSGSSVRGGGDLCEDRIKMIRDDIEAWIQKGGAGDLGLPAGVSIATYNKSMLAQLPKAQIRCVGAGDPGFPVKIGTTAKVCRFDKGSSFSEITCDYSKFGSMKEPDQYVLVHHEFAGLAGVESPNGADSNYQISNQISDDLIDEVVKRLAVRGAQAAAKQPSTPCPPPAGNAAGLFQILNNPNSNATDVNAYLQSHLVSFDAQNERCENSLYLTERLRRFDIYSDLYARAGSPDVNAKTKTDSRDSLYTYALAHGDTQTIQFDVSKGGVADAYGDTPLMIAARSNTSDVVYKILQASPKAVGETSFAGQWTALEYAAQSNNAGVVSELIQWGSDVNHLDAGETGADYKQNVLMAAAEQNSADVVSLLIKAGANVDYVNPAGQGVLYLALNDNKDKNIIPVVQSLLVAKANVNAAASGADGDGATPLMLAVSPRCNWSSADFSQATELTLTQVLLSAGASLNVASKDGRTALDYAASCAYLPVVKLLLAKGAVAGQQSSLLMVEAVSRNSEAVVLTLLATGVPVNVGDSSNDGVTPLMYAAQRKDISAGTIQAMLSAGADKSVIVTFRDYGGHAMTAYDLAVANNRSAEILKLLRP